MQTKRAWSDKHKIGCLIRQLTDANSTPLTLNERMVTFNTN